MYIYIYMYACMYVCMYVCMPLFLLDLYTISDKINDLRYDACSIVCSMRIDFFINGSFCRGSEA